MSISYPEDLRSYLTTRVLTVPMLMLMLLLLLAAWLTSRPDQPSTAGIQTLVIANLLVMFRLWDDLSDLATDRVTNPDRILCQTSHQTSFRRTCGILGITSFSILMSSDPKSGISFVLLTGFYAIYYKLPWRLSWPRLSYHLLIFKYPCFIALISVSQNEARPQIHLMVMFVTYLILCIYEVAHDPKLRADAWCRVIAGIELITAAIIAASIANSLL